jgi:hypothetical protein
MLEVARIKKSLSAKAFFRMETFTLEAEKDHCSFAVLMFERTLKTLLQKGRPFIMCEKGQIHLPGGPTNRELAVGRHHIMNQQAVAPTATAWSRSSQLF